MASSNRARFRLGAVIPQSLAQRHPPANALAILRRGKKPPEWLVAQENDYLAIDADGGAHPLPAHKVRAALEALGVRPEDATFDLVEKMVFARALKMWRRAGEMTQQEAADALKLGKATLQRWEAGECPYPAVLLRVSDIAPFADVEPGETREAHAAP